MTMLNARERRVLAVGLLLALIAGIWLALVAPVLAGFRDRAHRREELLAQYKANQRLLASTPALRASSLVATTVTTGGVPSIIATACARSSGSVRARASTGKSGM